MKKGKKIINLIKLIVALNIGGIMGMKLLVAGDLLMVLSFFVLCGVIGFILSCIDVK